MMKIPFHAFVVTTLLFTTAAAHAGDPPRGEPLVLTLEKAIAMALDQNRDVLIADQERYKAEAQVSEARSGAFPQITVSGQYTRNIKKPVLFIPPNSPINPSNQTAAFEIGSNNSYVGGAQLQQVLFSRKLGAALDVARAYNEYSEEAYRGTREDVTLQVKKAFYGVLLTQKLVEANKQGVDVVRANFENVRAQYRHGTAAEFDLLRAEVQLANTEPLLISAENSLLLAGNVLKNLLAIPLETDIRIQGTFTFEELDSAVLAEGRRNALTNNALLSQLALQESMLEENITIQRADFFPTLALFGGYTWQAQDNTFTWSNYRWANTMNVGLSLSFNLFDGFRTSARVEQASVDRQKIHYARLKAEEGTKIQIQAAELKMAEARKRIAGQEKTIEQAEKAVKIAQTRYKNGVGTQLELLDTQVAMTRAQTNYAQAIYDYLIARAEWQYAVGNPS
jgi:outer membrane protein TolC